MLNQYARGYLSHTQVFCWKFQKLDMVLVSLLCTKTFEWKTSNTSVLFFSCYTDSKLKGLVFVQLGITILPAYDKPHNRSDRAYHNFYMITSSADVLNNYSLFKNWWTSYEASRWQFSKQTSYNMYEFSGWISCHRRLKILSEKLTKWHTSYLQITNHWKPKDYSRKVSLFTLGICWWPLFLMFLWFVKKQDFF